MPDRAAGRYCLRRRDNGVGVNAIMPIEIGQRSGLTKMLDAEWTYPMTRNSAEPRECRRVSVEYGDQAAIGRHITEQPLDMRTRMDKAALARALSRGPPCVEPVGGGYCEQADIAAVLCH